MTYDTMFQHKHDKTIITFRDAQFLNCMAINTASNNATVIWDEFVFEIAKYNQIKWIVFIQY